MLDLEKYQKAFQYQETELFEFHLFFTRILPPLRWREELQTAKPLLASPF
jgi:hypothetical protein